MKFSFNNKFVKILKNNKIIDFNIDTTNKQISNLTSSFDFKSMVGQKVDTVIDSVNNNTIKINNLDYTSGNVIDYSGYTKRGLQLCSKNTIDMNFIDGNIIEFYVNSINWQLRRNAFVFVTENSNGEHCIVKALNWGYFATYLYSLDNEAEIGSMSLGKSFENAIDELNHVVIFFEKNKIYIYTNNNLTVSNLDANKVSFLVDIEKIKLYNSSNLCINLPYEKVNIYKQHFENESDITSKANEMYQQFLKEKNYNYFENKPFSNETAFNTVEDMINTNLRHGSIVSTLGYREIGDNGAATYEIVTYDEFYESLPEDCKYVTGSCYIKTTVDNFGNHDMKNRLVAKIIPTNNTFTPEQWGCYGDGIHGDTEALSCLLALFKTGTINFKDGSVYMINSRTKDECSNYVDNRFVKSMMDIFSGGCHRPLIANCKNLILNGNPSDDGNKATLKIPDNDFGFGMGMLDLGKTIDGLEIKNLIFDSNGLTILGKNIHGDSNKTSNHTICYAPGVESTANSGEEAVTPEAVFSNVNIHHNKFLSNGTMVNISDGGGDHLLIINPTVSENVFIEDNEFYDWGRWVFSVDLGGAGERFYNYKFNRNICIQTDDNKLASGSYRGLGWIDFEARKCFTNLEANGNIVRGLVGWAMNGNGKVLENFTFNDNELTFIQRQYRSAYPYCINFYSVRSAKNCVMNNNIFNQPYNVTPSGVVHNLEFKNNQMNDMAVLALDGIYGDIIIDNNVCADTNRLICVGSGRLSSSDYASAFPPYVDPMISKEPCNLVITNNIGGIIGSSGNNGILFNPLYPGLYDHLNITFENNTFLNVCLSTFDIDWEYDPSKNTILENNNKTTIMKGATFTSKTYFNNINNPICGCGKYKSGDLIAENVKMNRMELCPSFYTDQIQAGKTYNIYCEEDGYFVQLYTDTKLANNQKLGKFRYYFTNDNLYICCEEGTTPETGDLPTVTAREPFIFGTAKLAWVAKLGKIRAELVS